MSFPGAHKMVGRLGRDPTVPVLMTLRAAAAQVPAVPTSSSPCDVSIGLCSRAALQVAEKRDPSSSGSTQLQERLPPSSVAS